MSRTTGILGMSSQSSECRCRCRCCMRVRLRHTQRDPNFGVDRLCRNDKYFFATKYGQADRPGLERVSRKIQVLSKGGRKSEQNNRRKIGLSLSLSREREAVIVMSRGPRNICKANQAAISQAKLALAVCWGAKLLEIQSCGIPTRSRLFATMVLA